MTFKPTKWMRVNLVLLALVLTFSVFAKSNYYYTTSFLQGRYTSWAIDPAQGPATINLKESWKIFEKKREVTVAVIDTGIQFNHPFLINNIVSTQGKVGPTNFGRDFSKGHHGSAPYDTHGHGTHVAGIIKSIFPDVKILPLKYYNPQASGQANLESTIEALRFAVESNVDLINYSGGGPEPSKEERDILELAEKKGILVIAAAGNEKSNIDEEKNAYYPASYGLSNIITVGAIDKENKLIRSSNWGSRSVDIAAPGYRIRSAIPDNGAGYMTGTSQATAFVTGVVALIKSKFPRLNYQQVRNIVLSSSKKIGKLKGKILGSGKLDAFNALHLANQVHDKLFPSKGRFLARKAQ